MTVVAYDGRFIVADGRALIGTSLYSDKVEKLLRTQIAGLGPCIVGFAGSLDMLGPTLKTLQTNGLEKVRVHISSDESDEECLSMRVLVWCVNKKKLYEYCTDGGYFEINYPCAIGSGSYLASHYMKRGMSAATAIELTCETELSCGGQLMVYDIEADRLELK